MPSISLELISLGDKCAFSHLKEETAAHFSHVCCKYEFKLKQFTITYSSLFNKEKARHRQRDIRGRSVNHQTQKLSRGESGEFIGLVAINALIQASFCPFMVKVLW